MLLQGVIRRLQDSMIGMDECTGANKQIQELICRSSNCSDSQAFESSNAVHYCQLLRVGPPLLVVQQHTSLVTQVPKHQEVWRVYGRLCTYFS